MVFKKPYGFLIKHFKIIHFFLLTLFSFILYKSKNLLGFFQTYINNNYTTKLTDFASNYFDVLTLFIFLVVLSSLIAIFFLMKSKRKNAKYYIISIAYYSILLVIFILSYNILTQIESTSVAASTIRVYRDINNIAFYPQFIFIVFTLLRAIGFDIKSFNFKSDLEDLDLLDEDEEEVEVSLNIEGYKVKKTIRRTIRELKVYVLENKFVFTCIAGVALLIAIISLILNFQVYNKHYSLNKSFNEQAFTISYKKSILTNRDYQGNIIKEGKYYLATVIHLKNTTSSSQKLDTREFRLVIGNKTIYPSQDRSGLFVDVALPYFGTPLVKGTENDYVIVYELDEKEVKSSYTIKILSSIEYGKKEIIPRYKVINLKPDKDTKTSIKDKAALNDTLNFYGTSLGDTNFTINDYELVDRYEYSYNYCYQEHCYPSKKLLLIDKEKYFNKTLLVLDSNLELDQKTFYATDRSMSHNFYEDFITLRYTLYGKEYTTKLEEVTPKNLEDKKVFRVSSFLKDAEKIEAVITIRNKTYIIKMKG